jgi:hypothetical protein
MFLIVGCASTGTSVKNMFKSNEAGIAALAPLATGPGCQAAAQSLQPGENQIICTSLLACDKSFCAAAVAPIPVPSVVSYIPTVTYFTQIPTPVPTPVH